MFPYLWVPACSPSGSPNIVAVPVLAPPCLNTCARAPSHPELSPPMPRLPARMCSGDTELVSGPNGERPDWWWTGRKPEAGAPGILPDGSLTSLPAPNLASVTRQQALEYFENTWLITEVLFSALQGKSWGLELCVCGGGWVGGWVGGERGGGWR